MVNDAKAVPLSRDNKVLISSDRVLYILDEIDEALPTEIRQAKNVVADREQIIAEAKSNGEEIIRQAEERRKIMVSEHEITKAAEAQAREIVTDAKKKASEITKAANNYVDDIMKRTDELITGCAQDIRKARQSFKQSKK
jgi:vacuolar-type H+-ATPase subunit H